MPINLLPQKGRFRLERARLVNKVKLIAALSGGIFLVLFLLLWVAGLWLRQEEETLAGQVSGAKARVQQQRITEILLTLLPKRVGATQKILSTRKNTGLTLWQVRPLLGPAVSIKEAEAVGSSLKMTLVAASWPEMVAFRQNLPGEEIKKVGGKALVFSTVSRQPDGSYTAVLEISDDED